MTQPCHSGEPRPVPRAGRSEYAVVALIAVLGSVVLVESAQIPQAMARDSAVGPRVVPYLVGGLMLILAGALAVEIARGGRGEAEMGEDVDLDHPTDWRTFLGLIVLIGVCGQLIPLLGFPIAGAALFFGAARLLGSRTLARDVAVAVVVPTLAFLLFTQGLGVYLPAGPE